MSKKATKRKVIEFDKIYKGYRIIGLFLYMGHRTGYVVLNKEQEIKNFDYENIEVHGGITFNETSLLLDDETNKIENKVVLGFDCMHLGDKQDIESYKRYFKDNPDYKTMVTLMEQFPFDGKVRTVMFVANQLKSMVDQLIKYKRESEK